MLEVWDKAQSIDIVPIGSPGLSTTLDREMRSQSEGSLVLVVAHLIRLLSRATVT